MLSIASFEKELHWNQQDYKALLTLSKGMTPSGAVQGSVAKTEYGDHQFH